MKNILTIAQFTVREALSRKIVIAFFAISTFVILLFTGIFAFVPFEDLTGMIRMQNKEVINISKEIVKMFKLFVIAPLFGGGLFLAIFSASGFIPNMLEKGNIDLLLSKPISRSQIILGKFSGGVLIVLANIAYLIISIWFLIGVKFGIWNIDFLSSILTITFAFATLYALIILIGILTQSSVLSMMISYLIFFIFSPLLSARENVAMFTDSKLTKYILEFLYYIVPQTSELGSIAKDLALGQRVISFQPLLVSTLFIILILYLSIIIFDKKDY